MSDDKTRTAPQDAKRISLSENYEVQYWTDRFGVSRDELEKAVEAVGHSVTAVADHLERNRT